MEPRRWKRLLVVGLKAAITVLVVVAVGRHVVRTWDDLKRHEQTIQVRPARLAASGLLYLAALGCCGRFYEQVLRASPTPIATGPALRAYLISHLGKYVPGKAMVVVLRAGLSADAGARPATAAIATFYETLVMMASGCAISALGFALAGPSPAFEGTLPVLGRVQIGLYPLAGLLSLVLGVAFLVVVSPPLFRRLARTLSLPFPAVGDEAQPTYTIALLWRGLAWTGLGWLLLGASQLETARGLGATSDWDLAVAAAVTAGVAFATVAGFVVAVLPAGLGVREGVLMTTLGPAIGADLAVVAALALRLVWVAAELAASALLLPLRPRDRRPPSSSPPSDAGVATP